MSLSQYRAFLKQYDLVDNQKQQLNYEGIFTEKLKLKKLNTKMVGADYAQFVGIVHQISVTKKTRNSQASQEQIQIRTLESALGSPSGPPSGTNRQEELHPFAQFVKVNFTGVRRTPSMISGKKKTPTIDLPQTTSNKKVSAFDFSPT